MCSPLFWSNPKRGQALLNPKRGFSTCFNLVEFLWSLFEEILTPWEGSFCFGLAELFVDVVEPKRGSLCLWRLGVRSLVAPWFDHIVVLYLLNSLRILGPCEESVEEVVSKTSSPVCRWLSSRSPFEFSRALGPCEEGVEEVMCSNISSAVCWWLCGRLSVEIFML